MKIQELLALYGQSEHIQNLISAIRVPKSRVQVKGLIGSGLGVVVGSLFQSHAHPHVFVFSNDEDAFDFFADLNNLLEGKTICFYPGSFKRKFQASTYEDSLVLERAETLNRLKNNKHQLIVTTADAIAEWVIDEQELESNTYEIKQQSNLDIDFFVEFLNEHQFERVDFVYEPGTYSIRGGIIDVFSFSNEQPYRIELDEDIIESIRIFNPNDQLSLKKVDHFYIIPHIQKNKNKNQDFFHYLPTDTAIWFQDINLAKEQLNVGLEKADKWFNSNPEHELNFTDASSIWMSSSEFLKLINPFVIVEFGTQKHFKQHGHELVFQMSPQPAFHKNFKLLIANLNQNAALNIKNIIFSESSRQIERLYTIFEDLDGKVQFEPIYHGLSNGFIDLDLNLACYTERLIFDRNNRTRHRASYSGNKILSLKELKELKPGDYVTHIDHGIGKFAGLEKLEINGHLQEAVRLVYKNDDLLYVSINSLHKITKYVGKEGTAPKMNKLGSDAWEKLKTSTKKKVKDIARDLIKLYAKRKAQSGHAFQPDNFMQIELEASFMYEDTPDQLKATLELKKDMESPHPMDRLICGDVGFGKTEVAIRAAFKAICDSKQVAVLVPTTILANQHYRTFKERLKDFPCTIDYVNRFKSAAETKKVLEDVKEGKIDLLIGTHKLLSKAIQFKDLGLLIIDEEQKFGVAAKEKLKALKTNVDTLTLTATPIPRTLHFSLMGARDLSVINTPPPNRQPVNTELHNYNEGIIQEAISNEVERGGQVFFVHHRVKDIYEVADNIARICPGVKVGVAHGQLEGEKLEDVMIKFIEGEYDVLVATTIIEAGLDIPNANTIIINNANMFGLSDLHQMRGRVGRSNKKAFCYLLVPGIISLTNDARRRLQAIEEFSDLGSGFNVAMRDLDIRGAGNLLGGEQSGFIAEIGFEMYHKILDEAIHELKEDEFAELFQNEDKSYKLEARDCNLETDFEALIPDRYIRNSAERLAIYNQLALLKSEENILEFKNGLVDRFGKSPKQVEDLLDLIRVRELGKKIGFERMVLKSNRMSAYFPSEQNQTYFQSEKFAQILSHVQRYSSKMNLKQVGNSLLLLVQPIHTIQQALHELNGLLKQLNQ